MSLLTLAEFAYNNSTHTSIQETLFFANYGHHPKIDMLPAWKGESPAAEDFANQMKELHATMKSHLERAQSRYKEVANVKRKEQPDFKVGDKIWLMSHNINTNQSCDKLDYRRIDPFCIDKQINAVAYRLTLPPSMKVNTVFHTSLLEA